jgi:hypothetical protein
MNPSSLNIDFWLRRAKSSAVQSQKDMNQNRLGNELGETNKIFGSKLINNAGSPSTVESIFSARQLVICS